MGSSFGQNCKIVNYRTGCIGNPSLRWLQDTLLNENKVYTRFVGLETGLGVVEPSLPGFYSLKLVSRQGNFCK